MWKFPTVRKQNLFNLNIRHLHKESLLVPYLFQNVKQNQMCWQRGFVWKGSPEPEERIAVKLCSFFSIAVLSEVWRTLQDPHLQRTVDVATRRQTTVSCHV